MADSANLAESLAGEIFADNPVEEAVKWTPLKLTLVEYREGDPIGYCMAWISLVPFCVILSFIPLILLRRDLHTMSFFLGFLTNEIINWIIKHIIRQPRPATEKLVAVEYGMPSSHTQHSWFFATYLSLFIFIRIYRNFTWEEEIWKYIVSVYGFIVAFLVCFSRVYLEYHSVSQVVWGSVLGLVLGVSWFLIVNYSFTPFFPCIAAHPIGEFLMLRDSTLIPHVLWFEYTSSRTEARSRQRKFTSKKSM